MCTSSPDFLVLLLSFAKEGSGSREEEATEELYSLCLQYIRFSAVAEHLPGLRALPATLQLTVE